MSIDTPDWVRDAVFYQVFPDRFARSGRVEAPGPFEAWDEPPTGQGFKGGRPPGAYQRPGAERAGLPRLRGSMPRVSGG